MSLRAASVVYGLVLTVVAATTPVATAGEVALEGDVWGYFRPAKRPPTAFANIAELHLAGRGEYGWKASPPYFGMLKAAGTNRTTYALRQPMIEGLRIEFTTEAVAGLSYAFDGVLARPDFSRGGIPIDEVMLRGTMRKLKNCREIAAAELRFFFETGG